MEMAAKLSDLFRRDARKAKRFSRRSSLAYHPGRAHCCRQFRSGKYRSTCRYASQLPKLGCVASQQPGFRMTASRKSSFCVVASRQPGFRNVASWQPSVSIVRGMTRLTIRQLI